MVVRVHVEADAVDVDLIVDHAWSSGAIGIEETTDDAGTTLLIVAFDERGAALRLADRWRGDIEQVDAAAGLDAWRVHATTLTTRHWTIVPEWLVSEAAPCEDDDRRTIVLDAGRSFGAGSHLTTRLALDALLDLPVADHDVLDMGCGSGVLAIAAAHLGAANVHAVDIDPAALDATIHNTAINHAAAVSTPTSAIAGSADYDLIVANLLLADIEPIAADLQQRLRPGGELLTTGHLVAQRPRIVAAFRELDVVTQLEEDGWSLLVLRRTT